MKSSCALLMLLGVASSAALAQATSQPMEQMRPQPGGVIIIQDHGTLVPQPDAQSSGASSAAGAAGSDSAGNSNGEGGQLITESIARSQGAPNRTITLQAQTENGITYLCGGVGSEEANYLKTTAARDFNLMLTFAARSGNYVSDVNVAIADARGNPLLETNCDGPLMLVDLPKSGTYRVHANAGGHVQDRTVHVNAKGHTQAVFAWARDEVGVERASEFGGRMPRRSDETSSGANGSSGASGAPAGRSYRIPQ